MKCIFCSIVKGQVPADKVYENDYVLAFRDINPIAKIHIIVIPKECRRHFHDIEDGILAHLMGAVKHIVKEQGLEDFGYRLVNNNGIHGGQTVDHVHVHILAGEPLGTNLTGR
ncbi:MAG: histidine triad nucleotide-binding protein [Brevinema sp.]